MKKMLLLVLVLSQFLPVSTGFAQTSSDSKLKILPKFHALVEENAQLRDRVDALEKALGEINQKLNEQPAAAPAPAAPEKAKAPEKPSLKSKYNLDLYGYMKLDLAWDSSRTDTTGNYARWALSEAVVPKNDRQFNQTINQTRFGVNFAGPQAGRAKVSGKYEVDLYGGAVENSPMIRTRHAYFQVDWPGELSLLMGQTWDLIGPEIPNTLNYTAAWWTGNIGFRHPQLRLTKAFKAGSNKLVLAVAASRKVGDASTFDNTANGVTDTGADSGSPAFQGRIGYTFPTGKNLKSTIGVWGHAGNDEYDFNALNNHRTIRSSSLGADVNMAFSKTFQLKGEIWQGQNLDEYVGGVGQGIIVTSASGTYVNNAAFGGAFLNAEALKSQGGWVELNVGPFQKWRYNIGLSVDNPDDDKLPNLTGRTLNRSRWLNTMYDLNEAVQIGAEYLHVETDYKNQARGDDSRFQLSFIYKF